MKVLWDVNIVVPGAQKDVVQQTVEGVAVFFDPWLYRATLKDEAGRVVEQFEANPNARAVVHDRGVTIYRVRLPSEREVRLELIPHTPSR